MSNELRRTTTRCAGCLILAGLLGACSGGNPTTGDPTPVETPLPTSAVGVTSVAANPDGGMKLRPDTAAALSGVPVLIPVLANDTFPGNDFALTSITAPTRGTATIDANGTPGDPADDVIVYTPEAGYEGPDSFVYSVAYGLASGQAVVQLTVGSGPAATGTEVCGTVMKGPVAGATVTLYRVDPLGYPTGAPLAQTLTGETGSWCARIPSAREPALVVASGGTFDNEADGAGRTPVAFSQGEGLQTLLAADDSYVASTVFTHALLHRARAAAPNNDFFDEFARDRALFAAALDLDPVATTPANPVAPASNLPATASRYGMALGGAANALTAAAAGLGLTTPTYGLIDAFARDLSDCRLDGLEAGGVVLVTTGAAVRAMPAGIDLDREILRFRNNHAAQYPGVPVVSFDSAICSTTFAPAPPPDATPPVFALVPAPVVVARSAPGGTAANDPAIATWLAFAAAVDNRDGPVTVNHDAPDIFPTGETVVTFTATDCAGNSMTGVSAVTVSANAAPALTQPVPDQFATQGAVANLALGPYFQDPEGAALVYELSGLPDGTGLVMDNASGIVSGIPTLVDMAVAPMALTITASDGALSASTVMILNVLPPNSGPVNVAPTITGVAAALTTPEESPLAISIADLVVADPDSSGFTVALSPGPQYSLVGQTVVPAMDFNGVLSVPVTVNDGSDSSDPYTLTITVTAVNDAPTVTPPVPPPPVLGGTVAGPLPFSVGDVETPPGALLVTAASDDPTLIADSSITLAGSGVNRTLTLAPATGVGGVVTITVQVDDGEDTVAGSFQVTVLDGQQDTDGDGLTDGDEITAHFTDRLNPDSDGDDIRDGVEVQVGTDPLDPNARKIYVDPAVSSGDGLSWNSAYQNLNQAAPDILAGGGVPGDPLYVLIGDTRAQTPGSAWAIDLQGPGCDEVALVGSLGPGAVLAARDATDAPTTLLDVQGYGGPVLELDGCTNVSLFDVHLRGGTGDLPGNTTGGGIHVSGGSVAQFDGVWITGNTASAVGGGLAVTGSGSMVTLRNTLVADNTVPAGNGGGLYVGNGAGLVVEDSEIRDNTAFDEGGGFLVASGGFMTASGALVRGNLAATSGGLYGGGGGSVRGGLLMDNSVIADNQQTGSGGQPGGGGLYIENDLPVDIRHTLVVGNYSQADGGGVLAQRIAAPATLHNTLLAGNANDVGLGGGIHAVAVDSGYPLTIQSSTIVYNQTIAGLGGFQSGGGIDTWGNTGDAVLRDNIVWFNDDDVPGLQVDDNYYRHGSPPIVVEYNNIQTSTLAGSAGNIAGSPLFEAGFYLHPTASWSLDAGSTSAAAAQLGAPFGTAADGSADVGSLDQGYHYATASPGVTDSVVLTGERADCASGRVSLTFAPLVGVNDIGPGHVLEAVLGAGHSAGGVLTARTTLTPFGTAGSVLAIDQGQGEYRVELTGVDWSAGNRVQLRLRADSSTAAAFVLDSSELAPLFAADGC